MSTVFGAAAAGGFANIPQSSFTYRDVGVNITMTPRVTYEGEIIIDLTVESSNLGPNISVAGQDVPSFGSRRVKTRLRLREGESNLLAGLLKDDQRKVISGMVGLMRVPGLRSLFGATSDEISQTDIVMLLTPHIVRTHELTVDDLAPMYIGTQQNVGLTGPPPLIQAPPADDPAAAAGAAPAQPAAITTPTPQFLPPPPGTPVPATAAPPSRSSDRGQCAADGTARTADCACGSAAAGRGSRHGSTGADGDADRAAGNAAWRGTTCWRAAARSQCRAERGRGYSASARGAGHDYGAAGVADGRWAVHRSAQRRERVADVDGDVDGDVQSSRVARPQRAGGNVHAPGRSDGNLHSAHRHCLRPGRHRRRAQWRPRGRVWLRAPGGAAVRRRRSWQLLDSSERCRE